MPVSDDAPESQGNGYLRVLPRHLTKGKVVEAIKKAQVVAYEDLGPEAGEARRPAQDPY